VFVTVNENERPTLLGDRYRAWPSVELEFDEPVFFCSWSKEFPAGRARGTVFVLYEHDLRRWASSENDFELQFLKLIEPTDQGSWAVWDIRRVWEQSSSRALVFEDVDGELHTLSAETTKPTVAGIPLWKRSAGSNVVSLIRGSRSNTSSDVSEIGS